jgi:hypothetical protein
VLALWLVVALPDASARRRIITIAIVAVPAGLIGHGDRASSGHSRIEAATAGWVDPTVASAGLSIGVTLGDVQQLAQSRRIVLHVERGSDDLRAVYIEFDGREWRPARVVRVRISHRPSACWTFGLRLHGRSSNRRRSARCRRRRTWTPWTSRRRRPAGSASIVSTSST